MPGVTTGLAKAARTHRAGPAGPVKRRDVLAFNQEFKTAAGFRNGLAVTVANGKRSVAPGIGKLPSLENDMLGQHYTGRHKPTRGNFASSRHSLAPFGQHPSLADKFVVREDRLGFGDHTSSSVSLRKAAVLPSRWPPAAELHRSPELNISRLTTKAPKNSPRAAPLTNRAEAIKPTRDPRQRSPYRAKVSNVGLKEAAAAQTAMMAK